MRPLKQRFKHDPENGVWGDCYRAAFASVLELDLDDVPHFSDGGPSASMDTLERAEMWLRERGLRTISITFTGDLREVLMTVGRLNGDDLIYLLSGTSRTGVNHTVVCQGSKIAHDPSLTDAGIAGPCDDGLYWLTFFAPLHLEQVGR